MSNLRSLSSRQKKATREMPAPMYNKNVQPNKQLANPNMNVKKEPEKSKITIGDAIGLITIRLGKVEQFILDLNMDSKYLNNSVPVIDQNQNMNTTQEQLILLNSSLERIENVENAVKKMDKFDSDLRDTKDLLIKLVAKQEKNLAEQELQNSNIYTFINDKLHDLVDKKVNELLNNRVNEIISSRIDELVSNKVNELLKKTADEIVSRNVDDIINIKYNEVVASSNQANEVEISASE